MTLFRFTDGNLYTWSKPSGAWSKPSSTWSKPSSTWSKPASTWSKPSATWSNNRVYLENSLTSGEKQSSRCPSLTDWYVQSVGSAALNVVH